MAQGRKTQLAILLTPKERKTLQEWQRSTIICHGQARRARIILMVSEGVPVSQIARMVGIARGPIYKWAKRFQQKRLSGLDDKPGRGREPFFPSRGSDPSGEDGLRAPLRRGKIALPVGLHGTDKEAH